MQVSTVIPPQPPVLTPAGRARLLAAGRQAFPAFALETVSRTPSTQDRVLARARRGAPAGWCCVAGEQTTGRGRQGRRWLAPAGTALLTSVLLRPPPHVLPLVPLAAGVAAAEALAGAAGLRAGLKWPNDVMVRGAKLAGLLAEVEPAAQGPDAVVLGMGLNLQVETFPDEVRGISLHRVVAEPPAWDTLLAAWLGSLSVWLNRAERGEKDLLLDAWRRHAVGLGSAVRASTPGGTIHGVATGIDGDGALLVSTEGGRVRLVAGDVHLVDDDRGGANRRKSAGAAPLGDGAAPADRPRHSESSRPT
ncbi:MAG: biotin--[acetyl-CoA-carboxylase] ligase [Candidatus Dormibacteria bacterium]